MQDTLIRDVASTISDVRDEIARRLRTDGEVVLVVPHDDKGKPNYAGTFDDTQNRTGIQSLIPDGVNKGTVLERVISVGPQDDQPFSVTPEPRTRATAYRILAV